MPTIADVARAAGVSTATVSRALGGSTRISEGTRARVVRVVAELGYAPNVAAKALRTTRSSKILVTVPNIANPFFGRVLRSIEQAAFEAGYAVLLGDTGGEDRREDAFGAMLHGKEADGIIVLGHRLPATLREVVARRGPAAPVVGACSVLQPGLSATGIDNFAAAREIMSLIYRHGHEVVGAIGGTVRSPVSTERFEGALAAARQAGCEERLSVVRTAIGNRAGFDAALELLRGPSPVTAIFCISDELALGAIAAVRTAGLRCPQDVSVVGFDDLPYAPFLHPALTTVAQPMEEMGRRAVELLLGVLTGKADEIRHVVLPHEVVERASLAPRSR